MDTWQGRTASGYRVRVDPSSREVVAMSPLDNMPDKAGGSVERVRAALRAAGHPDTITAFPAETRTAADAAAAVGCTIAQIAKSIVFRAGGRAAVVVASGANRVDRERA